MEISPYYIDLFSGCGGLSLGLYKSGWKGLFAVEKNDDAFSTLKYNLIDNIKHFYWPKWLPITNHDINDLLTNYKSELMSLEGKVPLVVGGPPCQGFSIAGKRNEDDQRNSLSKSYIDFISLIKPKFIFFENVKGFTIGFTNENGRGKPYSDYITRELEELGYSVMTSMIDISRYGIPQCRTRFVLIACKNPYSKFNLVDCLNRQSGEFLQRKRLSVNTCLADAISDLLKMHGTIPCKDSKGFYAGVYGEYESEYQRFMRSGNIEEYPNSHRFAKHKKETINKYSRIISEAPMERKSLRIDGGEYNISKRGLVLLHSESKSPTLTTHPDDLIHYCEPRILTVREYARIQSFPDWYIFKGRYTSGGRRRSYEVPRYSQVGNAVPPLFAEQIGNVIMEHYRNGRNA